MSGSSSKPISSTGQPQAQFAVMCPHSWSISNARKPASRVTGPGRASSSGVRRASAAPQPQANSAAPVTGSSALHTRAAGRRARCPFRLNRWNTMRFGALARSNMDALSFPSPGRGPVCPAVPISYHFRPAPPPENGTKKAACVMSRTGRLEINVIPFNFA